MSKLNRRLILAGAASIFGLSGSGSSIAVDLGKLNEAPASGEMQLGPADAKVTIIEYASASCPHCAKFHKEAFPVLKKDYIDPGKVRFILREFPHNQAGLAAFMVARCAPKEKYFPILDAIFETQDSWLKQPADGLYKIAQMAGFTRAAFDACLKNEAVAKGILAVRDKGANELGIQGVPTFFINGEKLAGGYDLENIKSAIDPLLGK
jgi:protein-disulfide isomerase